MDKPRTHHVTHPDVLKRLRRADGHLRSIIEMIEGERECLDIVQQLHAVEKAVANAKQTLIHDHIDHCLEKAGGPMSRGQRGIFDDFKEITKYL